MFCEQSTLVRTSFWITRINLFIVINWHAKSMLLSWKHCWKMIMMDSTSSMRCLQTNSSGSKNSSTIWSSWSMSINWTLSNCPHSTCLENSTVSKEPTLNQRSSVCLAENYLAPPTKASTKWNIGLLIIICHLQDTNIFAVTSFFNFNCPRKQLHIVTVDYFWYLWWHRLLCKENSFQETILVWKQ